jgi:hypothetical protein
MARIAIDKSEWYPIYVVIDESVAHKYTTYEVSDEELKTINKEVERVMTAFNELQLKLEDITNRGK